MSSHLFLAGSERRHPENSVFAAPLAPDQEITITLVLRRKQQPPADSIGDAPLTREHLATTHGADPADVETTQAFAHKHGLAFIDAHRASRCVYLSGPFSTLAPLFAADVEIRLVAGKLCRTRQGSLRMPEELAPCVVAVLGFDQRPVSTTRRHIQPHSFDSLSYTPAQIAKFYNFPSSTGQGQTIALIELGGGYRESDLQAYWKQLGLPNDVSVTSVSVDGAQNSPSGDPDSADGEVVLDIEVAGAVAPGANIAVYFAANTDQSFLNAINSAIHDSKRKPSVISISWGAAESEWTPQAMNAFNAAFEDAALLGITVCVASGDNGSSDGESDNRNHVDFPASSPWALACGGTRLLAPHGQITSETVWNDGTAAGATGGGVSSHFSRPKYQANIPVPKPSGTTNSTGRGVPDVAGVADPQTGYLLLVDGQQSVVGGTSAVAPLWAALIALFNQQLGKNIGWFQPMLYGTLSVKGALRDITSGNNGTYHAAKGWDPCTGLGTPNGTDMLQLLAQQKK